MHKIIFFIVFFCAELVVASPIQNVNLIIDLEVPTLPSDSYFKPYIVVWIENENREYLDTIALWYQVKRENSSQEDGKKWLKDLRQWWRKSGRKYGKNIDAVTGATRRPGHYRLHWQLTPEYQKKTIGKPLFLHIEAVREEGGRRFQRIPIEASTKTVTRIPAKGELGEISLTIKIEK